MADPSGLPRPRAKTAPAFPTLNDRERRYPAMPAVADGFPDGWTLRRVPRPGDGDKVATLFFSPILGVKFPSRPEARRFLECLREAGGDEALAARLLSERKRARAPGGRGKCAPVPLAPASRSGAGSARSTVRGANREGSLQRSIHEVAEGNGHFEINQEHGRHEGGGAGEKGLPNEVSVNGEFHSGIEQEEENRNVHSIISSEDYSEETGVVNEKQRQGSETLHRSTSRIVTPAKRTKEKRKKEKKKKKKEVEEEESEEKEQEKEKEKKNHSSVEGYDSDDTAKRAKKKRKKEKKEKKKKKEEEKEKKEKKSEEMEREKNRKEKKKTKKQKKEKKKEKNKNPTSKSPRGDSNSGEFFEEQAATERDSTGIGPQKNVDRKNPADEKLIELSPGQAAETKFPPGCQVVYNCKTNAESKGTVISMGVVRSAKVSLAGNFVYGIGPVAAAAGKEHKGDVTFTGERYLAYAPGAPILYHHGTTPVSAKEGTVLLSSGGGDDACELRYAVLTPSGEGGHVIHRDVPPERLSFFPVSSPRGSLDGAGRTSGRSPGGRGDGGRGGGWDGGRGGGGGRGPGGELTATRLVSPASKTSGRGRPGGRGGDGGRGRGQGGPQSHRDFKQQLPGPLGSPFPPEQLSLPRRSSNGAGGM